jgi:hypothetical protein
VPLQRDNHRRMATPLCDGVTRPATRPRSAWGLRASVGDPPFPLPSPAHAPCCCCCSMLASAGEHACSKVEYVLVPQVGVSICVLSVQQSTHNATKVSSHLHAQQAHNSMRLQPSTARPPSIAISNAISNADANANTNANANANTAATLQVLGHSDRVARVRAVDQVAGC